MSRAMRRHPMASKPTKQAPLRPMPKGRKPAKDAPKPKRGLMALLRPHWLEEIIAELRKVTWPSAQETRSLTFVVIVVSVAAGAFLGIVDIVFNWLINQVLIR